MIYWRLMSAMFGFDEDAPNFEAMSLEIVNELEMPELILNPNIGVDTFLHRYPEMEDDFKLEIKDDEDESATLKRGLILSKLLINVFGPNSQSKSVTAQQYSQWLKDVEALEKACGCPKGGLRAGGTGSLQGKPQQGKGTKAGDKKTGQGGNQAGEDKNGGRTQSDENDGQPKWGGSGAGNGFDIPLEDIREALANLEKDLLKRMNLHEILQDDRLAQQLNPSMDLLEQILRDKSNLSGNALKNGKRIVQQYIQELAEVLRLQVKQTPAGKIDRSVPPKRVYRNLDLKRTIWKNLTNWNEDEQRLYVDRLFYKHTGRKRLPTRLIVVVDQSGSMVNAMVQCTILASIFAGLPDVDVHLLAFDTRVMDLTQYVRDPFEVLMRTQLGGGTHINLALLQAMEKIINPRQTAVVLITDFYEGGSNQVLLDTIKSIKQSGAHFIPVGSVSSSGYFSVNEWFRSQLKDLGMPVLTGSPKKLIAELKQVIVT